MVVRRVRFKSKRLGLNEESRKEVVKLIEKSKIVCFNCFIKYENDIIDITATETTNTDITTFVITKVPNIT